MILVNSQKATLTKFNRTDVDDYFDDQNFTTETIQVVPYGVDQAIKFGVYTIPEATGYYLVKGDVDVREGDQITFIGKFKNANNPFNKVATVLKIQDGWLFNRVESKVVIVK